MAGIGGIKCTDKSTGIGGIATLFNGDAVGVTVEGLEWEELDAAPANASSILYWETLVGDSVTATASVDLAEYNQQLPTELAVGNVTVNKSGAHTITVKLVLQQEKEEEHESNRTYQSYSAAVSIIPLIVVLVLAMTTQMVEFSLFFTVFVGACMVRTICKCGMYSTICLVRIGSD